MSDAPEAASVPAPQPAEPARRLDARSLRGLAHPLRMNIFELPNLDGPATATRLAERLGENTGTTSWHLRHLGAAVLQPGRDLHRRGLGRHLAKRRHGLGLE